MITITNLDPAGGAGRHLVEASIDAYGDLDLAYVSEELLALGQRLVGAGIHPSLADAVWRHGAYLTGLLGLRWLAPPNPSERHTYVAALGEVPARQLEDVREVIRLRAEGAAIAELEKGQSALDRRALADLFLELELVLVAALDRRLRRPGRCPIRWTCSDEPGV